MSLRFVQAESCQSEQEAEHAYQVLQHYASRSKSTVVPPTLPHDDADQRSSDRNVREYEDRYDELDARAAHYEEILQSDSASRSSLNRPYHMVDVVDRVLDEGLHQPYIDENSNERPETDKNIELLSPKQNGSASVEGDASGKAQGSNKKSGSIKGMWKKAFRSVKTKDKDKDRDKDREKDRHSQERDRQDGESYSKMNSRQSSMKKSVRRKESKDQTAAEVDNAEPEEHPDAGFAILQEASYLRKPGKQQSFEDDSIAEENAMDNVGAALRRTSLAEYDDIDPVYAALGGKISKTKSTDKSVSASQSLSTTGDLLSDGGSDDVDWSVVNENDEEVKDIDPVFLALKKGDAHRKKGKLRRGETSDSIVLDDDMDSNTAVPSQRERKTVRRKKRSEVQGPHDHSP